ncbi:hypothetical protein [Paracoccus niistensis]|uniref:Nucleotidyltransferase family protein n=1 Tax=Paracoccus niistensis TaxID=632935 RepID=A0ABV6I2Z6_9RHOB
MASRNMKLPIARKKDRHMNQAMPIPAKHRAVPGIDLATLRRLLAYREKNRLRWLLPVFMDALDLNAPEADALLRKVAAAGYIEWMAPHDTNEEWSLTAHGSRLIADPMQERMNRAQATAILDKVLERIRRINAAPDRLVYVRDARLYGSLLDEAASSFGDVDIEITLCRRPLPEEECARVQQLLSAKVPDSWHSNPILRHQPERRWDERQAKKEIRQGLKGLSLSEDVTQELGCAYRVVLDYDWETRSEASLTGEIIPRTTPSPDRSAHEEDAPVPDVTIIPPLGLLDPDEGLPGQDLHLCCEKLSFQEARAWMGEFQGQGRSVLDTRKMERADLRFAGAAHLFPDWKDRSLTGLELFVRALDWAAGHDFPIAKAPRRYMLRTYDKTRIATFAGLVVKRVADRVEAYLVPSETIPGGEYLKQHGTKGEITPRMVAAHHAICVALGRMLDETRLTGRVSSQLDFDLDGLRRNHWPALPDLSRVSGILRRGLPKVQIPEAVLKNARRRKGRYSCHLPIEREVEIEFDRDVHEAGMLTASFRTNLSRWLPGDEPRDDDDWVDLPGEDELISALEAEERRLDFISNDLPGCRRIKIWHEAPIKA